MVAQTDVIGNNKVTWLSIKFVPTNSWQSCPAIIAILSHCEFTHMFIYVLIKKNSLSVILCLSSRKSISISFYTHFILDSEKLLAPKASISLKVIRYPFGPLVSASDSESILKGSTAGRPISGIPETK